MDYTRDELRDLHARSSLIGLSIFAADCAFYALAIAGVVLVDFWPLRILSCLLAAVAVGGLFVVGHDGCHQALTPRRWLNRLIGTLAFLPSLSPYSLWDLLHNRTHHRWTNRRNWDHVWEPLTFDEFQQLSPWRQRVYKFYRTPFGHFWYYLITIWGKRMFFPRRSVVGKYRPEYVFDLAVCTLWAIGFPTLLGAIWLARHPDSGPASIALTIALGFVVPWFLFKALISFAIFLHHTHPAIEWMPEDAVVDSASQVRSTVHVVFPPLVNWVFHSIMDHTAHHLRPGIPCYKLPQGQKLIEGRTTDVIIHRWSPRSHRITLERCKLFDLKRRCWTDYNGVPLTSPKAERDDSKLTAAPTGETPMSAAHAAS